MCGSEEASRTSPLMQSYAQEQQEGAFIDDNDDRSSFSSPKFANKKLTKERLTSNNLSTISEKNSPNPSSLPLSPRSSKPHITITSEDVEAAFDSIETNKTSSKNKSKNTIFGLSTIEENLSKDDHVVSSNASKRFNDDEIDFQNILTKVNQIDENKKRQMKLDIHPSNYQSDDIQTPSVSIDTQTNTNSSFSTTMSNKNQMNDMNDSTDEDVDELLGKFEVNILGKYAHTYIHIYILMYFYI